ncbi:putative integral membrane protein [Babesia bovis T2Bo]|uniref:Mcm6 C-terminal winged-helix domain-containing protein n=1 Tax=Babesia bovis TaxID=5865 RepID=A7AR47_BABBO|nr:putative integral membrane protein [Babesia bovis T2Bo]EDO07016.1 putative integral membrane protein [Babesia bovis T2Bo]|eukprot:XP_001610584.1 hypothetical protein [Babesia bovis T2Bo]
MSNLQSPSNLYVEFGAYVHFAYYIGVYLIQRCPNEACNENQLVNWYLERYRGLLSQTDASLSKLQLLYGKLINNLLRDECLTVFEETSEGRIVKKHPSFFVWAWRSQAKSHEYNVLHL